MKMTFIRKKIYSVFLMFFVLTSIKIDAQMITTYAGKGILGATAGGPITPNTTFQLIDALAYDPSGNLYVSTDENKIFKITSGGIISLFAGTGAFPNSGDGLQATSAGIGRPRKIKFDAAGNCYFSSSSNHTIRKINTSGVISTIVGTGVAGNNGDGILATTAQIAYPDGFGFDSAGNLYFICGDNVNTQGSRVRRVDNTTGLISTIAGTGINGDSGNGGFATSAQLAAFSLAIDANDDVFISNYYSDGIRKINLTTGIITNFAGNGSSGYSGDGGQALLAQFGEVWDMNFDNAGNLYMSEWYSNSIIRKIDITGIVSTVAGTGISGFSGDGGAPTFAQLNIPTGFAISNSGNEIYIGDNANWRIRKVDLLATPICPNTFSITKTHLANGEVLITPNVSPFLGSPNYMGTIDGDPIYNPLATVNVNTTTTHTEYFPGNGIYDISLTYIDTISSFVCTRNLTDTISITNSTTPRSFNRNFQIVNDTYCNTGSPYFIDNTTFQYSLNNPSANYTIVTNWGNGDITTENVTATNQISITSATTTYINPGVYTVQSILSGGGVANDTVVTFVTIMQCGDLQGSLFNDIDNNCAQDWWNGEYPIQQNIPLKATDGTNTYFTWSIGGYYNFSNIIAGTYTIEVLNNNSGYVITCANSMPHSTTVIASQVTTENFAMNCSGGFDISTTGISLLNGLFPGQGGMVLPHVGVVNGSCDFVVAGEVRMILTPCLQYTPGGSNTNAPDLIIPASTGDTLVWYVSDINNIGNYSYWNYGVYVDVCTTAVVGDSACVTMMVLPTAGDNNDTNNVFTRCFVIGVSYDPNFKEVSPKGYGVEGFIPETTSELTYTLHFQNTGTAQAFNISLLDTISTNLDLYSIEIISSSHYVQPYLLSGRTMKFMFPNINLPDSTTDEENSHGYVTYKIKLNSGLAPGTEIKNTCYIYFDYNDAVVTNTTVNTIELLNGISENVANDFIVFPNPATSKINIQVSNNSEYNLLMTDVLGKEIMASSKNKFVSEINVSELENGIYFITIFQDGKTITKKVIISK